MMRGEWDKFTDGCGVISEPGTSHCDCRLEAADQQRPPSITQERLDGSTSMVAVGSVHTGKRDGSLLMTTTYFITRPPL